jgi:hypothetical protein
MKPSQPLPCREWAERLAAAHPDDLAPAERAALEAHVASCQACLGARANYHLMDTLIRGLPAPAPLPAIPPRLAQLWADEDGRVVTRVAAPQVAGNGRGAADETGPNHRGMEQRMSAMSPLPAERHATPPRATRRPAGWIGASAAVAVALLFTLVFLSLARGQHVGSGSVATPPAARTTPTLAAPLAGDWRAAYLGQDGRVHTVAPDGSRDLPGSRLPNARFITDPLPLADTAASPDGRSLAYIAGDGYGSGGAISGGPVAIMNLVSGATVTASLARGANLFWAPDSMRLAVDTYVTGTTNNMLYIIDASKGHTTAVSPTYNRQPAVIERAIGWIDADHVAVIVDRPASLARVALPHGTQLLSARLSGGPNLGVASVDVGMGAVRYLADLVAPPDVYLSPDGKDILIASSTWQASAEVINTATGQVRALPNITAAFADKFVHTDNAGFAQGGNWSMHVAWKPGTHVVAMSLAAASAQLGHLPGAAWLDGLDATSQPTGVWLLDLDADSATQIVSDAYPLAWLPDAQTLFASAPPPSSTSGTATSGTAPPTEGAGVGPALYALTPVAPGVKQKVLATTMVVFLGLVRVQHG